PRAGAAIDAEEHRAVCFTGQTDLDRPAVIAVDAEFLIPGRQLQPREDLGRDILPAGGAGKSRARQAWNRFVRESVQVDEVPDLRTGPTRHATLTPVDDVGDDVRAIGSGTGDGD